jgi:hypothetical protein
MKTDRVRKSLFFGFIPAVILIGLFTYIYNHFELSDGQVYFSPFIIPAVVILIICCCFSIESRIKSYLLLVLPTFVVYMAVIGYYGFKWLFIQPDVFEKLGWGHFWIPFIQIFISVIVYTLALLGITILTCKLRMIITGKSNKRT